MLPLRMSLKHAARSLQTLLPYQTVFNGFLLSTYGTAYGENSAGGGGWNPVFASTRMALILAVLRLVLEEGKCGSPFFNSLINLDIVVPPNLAGVLQRSHTPF